ncbi:hypothetical protein WICPIJ_008059 [Wickerhamomyces pijperi]|uniref:Uncharacterized protein n=1 Tax=Wickerhamomyces pijperi TaxID=599730 RepID=A0A9P8TJD0_WICPI|nr:hypothetical protein WICPIJ_008059 [Wickerhamomyces pijperi]
MSRVDGLSCLWDVIIVWVFTAWSGFVKLDWVLFRGGDSYFVVHQSESIGSETVVESKSSLSGDLNWCHSRSSNSGSSGSVGADWLGG